MSTSQPGPRRRRIAGERRGRVLPEDAQQPAPERPVVLDKEPRRPAGSSTAPPVTPGRSDKPAKQSKAAETPTAPTVTVPDTDERKKSGPTGWWGSRMSLVALSVVLAVLLLLTGLAALGMLGTDGLADLDEAEAVERSTRTAPAAAEAAAAAILAYDHESLDADQDAASRFMTDEFADEYGETFEKVVRPAAESTRAKVTATVLASAVIRADEDTARVLVFVDQATTSTESERPRIALNRVEMSMVREGDSWVVGDISSY